MIIEFAFFEKFCFILELAFELRTDEYSPSITSLDQFARTDIWAFAGQHEFWGRIAFLTQLVNRLAKTCNLCKLYWSCLFQSTNNTLTLNRDHVRKFYSKKLAENNNAGIIHTQCDIFQKSNILNPQIFRQFQINCKSNIQGYADNLVKIIPDYRNRIDHLLKSPFINLNDTDFNRVFVRKTQQDFVTYPETLAIYEVQLQNLFEFVKIQGMLINDFERYCVEDFLSVYCEDFDNYTRLANDSRIWYRRYCEDDGVCEFKSSSGKKVGFSIFFVILFQIFIQ